MNRINPFAAIYKICNSGKTNKEKNALRSKLDEPLLIDVELTNSCNLQCYMCPTGTNSLKRPRGFMSTDVMERIYANVKESAIRGVRFILWGEPTLHPQFLDFAAKIKDAGKLVHFNTNGILLTEEMIQAIVTLEIDSMKFSFQGVDQKSYEEMRFGSDWNKIIQNIERLHSVRGEREKPFIQISTTITDEDKARVDRFIKAMQPFCDYINVGKTILDYLDVGHMNISEERKKEFINLKGRQSLLEKHLDVCPEVYNKLSILWNGDVTMCCNDYDGKDMVIGNITQKSIKELWNAPKAREICKKLEEGYDQIEICRNCYEYIALESGNDGKHRG